MLPVSSTSVFSDNEELHARIKHLDLTGKITRGKRALGTGAHSDVFKGLYHKDDGVEQDVAIKRLRFHSGERAYCMAS